MNIEILGSLSHLAFFTSQNRFMMDEEFYVDTPDAKDELAIAELEAFRAEMAEMCRRRNFFIQTTQQVPQVNVTERSIEEQIEKYLLDNLELSMNKTDQVLKSEVYNKINEKFRTAENYKPRNLVPTLVGKIMNNNTKFNNTKNKRKVNTNARNSENKRVFGYCKWVRFFQTILTFDYI